MTDRPSEQVSEQILEFLLTELVGYARASTATTMTTTRGDDDPNSNDNNVNNNPQHSVVTTEMAAAKLERIGHTVGYRLTERLAQQKTWNTLHQDAAAQTAAQQLEAVKFLCKDVWSAVFGKQIDKLQTNHRGVFVLKDLNLQWLQQLNETEASRLQAIQLLAVPCGMIRGCLQNLGIPCVVSCDFLADGQHMAACSFNIKVK